MSKPSDYVELIAREQSSTGRLHKLLDLAERKFPEFRDWPGLRVAVNSQGELANFTDDALQIASCSLNTLKKRANGEIGVGWECLDSLRRKIDWKFQKESSTRVRESRPGRGSKAELELKLKEIRDDYRQLESDNWQLVKGIRGLLKLLDSIIEQYPLDALSKQVQTERAEVLAMFGVLNQPKVVRNETSERQ
ncbi:hypothetical protein PQR02_35495 [Paraburkholderia sediminicola]|uniref:Uncharacterized protein n=1 Tax=Paraburkholderia rhynchosiae TaxID=487049 RepID=A0ACC7NLU2_9BURK